MAVPQSENLDRERILSLLAAAQAAINADRLAEAATLYQSALADPGLEHMPTARTEVLSNCGALLLHQARLTPDDADTERRLDDAIDMLSRARMYYRLGQGEGSSVTTDTNLALAFFQRHLANGQRADIMRAHIALDGAEAVIDADDANMVDWVKTIRDMLIEHVDRRREPR